jgi:NodT family efflux transporter outer membrane factor (OMF) lipoprotein
VNNLRLAGLGAAMALCGAALLLAACAAPGPMPPGRTLADPVQWGATPVRPVTAPVPAGALAASVPGAVSEATLPDGAYPWPAARWWATYGDTQLDRLVDLALSAQPTLAQAQARIEQARAAVAATEAAHGPQVALSADVTGQRFSRNGLVPPAVAGTNRWTAGAQLGAHWELDLFGRQRAQVEAAIGRQRAAQVEGQAARVLLASQVVSAYLELARLMAQQQAADTAVHLREQALTLARQRLEAGLDRADELRRAQAALAQAQREHAQLAEAAVRARHALAELAGQGPRALAALAPVLPDRAAAALPETLHADLVGRRADLVAQRWRVEAAWRDIDVARAEFHPNLNLMGFLGLSSLGLDRLLQAGSLTYGAGPALRLPIFDGGRLRAQLGERGAQADAAVEAWNATLLRALREVADEVEGLRAVAQQRQLQRQAQAAADAALELVQQRRRAGLSGFGPELAARVQQLVEHRAALDLQARQALGEAALARALGGGWVDDLAGPPAGRTASPAIAAHEPSRSAASINAGATGATGIGTATAPAPGPSR